jgi:hypothetical protein
LAAHVDLHGFGPPSPRLRRGRQFQFIPGEDIVQERSVDLRLFEHLIDSSEVFVSPRKRLRLTPLGR